jgi:REP element-mobilizing transposase RayT
MNRDQPRPDPQRLVAGFHARGGLPHLKREGGAYFVTFRLAVTLPQAVLARFKAEREAIVQQALMAKRPLTWHEQEELFRWYSVRVDKYLDAGLGDCWLQRPEIARLVAEAIQFHQGVRFELHAWCLMPNHVHAVLRPLPGWTLSQILKSWKGFTARSANQILERTGKPFWQTESFDHLIRDENDLHRCGHYTIMNPVNADFCNRPEDWEWSSAHKP